MRIGIAPARTDAMSSAAKDPKAMVLVEEREPQPVLSIRSTVAVAGLAQAQGERLSELWRSMQGRGVAPLGPPFVRYHTFGETETDVELGFPVSAGVAGAGRIEAGQLPGGAAIVTWHLGAHDSLGDAYRRLEQWLDANAREAAGSAWEVYWWIDPDRAPDPSSWPAPTEWRTELEQPVDPVAGGEA
jgi:effector-binding domain-containing protein